MKGRQSHLQFAEHIRLLGLAGVSLAMLSCDGHNKEPLSNSAVCLPATSEKTQAETAENWQEIIRDSGRDEAEKANLLSWAKDSNGISLLKHLSVWTSVDNGPYHTGLTPIANRLAWKDAFAVATSGSKRQVLLYSSSGFRPFLSAIVITDGEGRLIRWVAPTIKDDVGRAAILNTEKGTELAVDPACEYFYDVYSSEPRGPQRCRNVYRFLLRDDGITQLDVKHCDPDTLFGPTPRAVIERTRNENSKRELETRTRNGDADSYGID